MTRFYGKIGFVSTEETSPGVWTEKVEVRRYRGDVNREGRRWDSGQKVNDEFVITNYISIVADKFAYDNFSAMRWVEWMGKKWKVNSVEIAAPRMTLTIGGLYNGDDEQPA